MKARPTPAFVLARVFVAGGAGVAAFPQAEAKSQVLDVPAWLDLGETAGAVTSGETAPPGQKH